MGGGCHVATLPEKEPVRIAQAAKFTYTARQFRLLRTFLPAAIELPIDLSTLGQPLSELEQRIEVSGGMRV